MLNVSVNGQCWVIIQCSSSRDGAVVRPAVLPSIAVCSVRVQARTMLSTLVGISIQGLFTLEGNRNVSPYSAFMDSWLMVHLSHISRATKEEKSLRTEAALCCPVELWSEKMPGDYLASALGSLGHSLVQLPN